MKISFFSLVCFMFLFSIASLSKFAAADPNYGFCCSGGSGGAVPTGGCCNSAAGCGSWQANPCGTVAPGGDGNCPAGYCPCGGGGSVGTDPVGNVSGKNFIKWLDKNFNLIQKTFAVQNAGNSGCCPCGGGGGSSSSSATSSSTSSVSCISGTQSCPSKISAIGCQ